MRGGHQTDAAEHVPSQHRFRENEEKRQSFSTPWFSLIKPKSKFDFVVLPCSSRYKTHSGIFVYPSASGNTPLRFPRQEKWLRRTGLGGRRWRGSRAKLDCGKEFCWCFRKAMIKIQVGFLLLCQNHAGCPETCSSKMFV